MYLQRVVQDSQYYTCLTGHHGAGAGRIRSRIHHHYAFPMDSYQ